MIILPPDHGWRIPETIKSLASAQQNFDNITPFEYNFLDERIRDFYDQEGHEAVIINIAAVLALLIACLGLFGLASFSTEKRTKEIGIRKVLGANSGSIAILIIKEFIRWIIIANLIAWRTAYFVMNKWLQDFAYRINISWWMFVFAGGIALLIALATISFQAIKAATANPVESLKYE